jgi:hypothetical protein
MRDSGQDRRQNGLHQVAGDNHTYRAIPGRHLTEVGEPDIVAGRVRPGEPQVFDSLTISCTGCGRSIPPGEVFTRYPTPDDRRRDLTSPFCQTCRPIGPAGVEPEADGGDSTQDLLSALRKGLERQAKAESGTEG